VWPTCVVWRGVLPPYQYMLPSVPLCSLSVPLHAFASWQAELSVFVMPACTPTLHLSIMMHHKHKHTHRGVSIAPLFERA
jgi:hypothetical protein